MSGLHFAAVNAEGIVADLDLLPAAYRVLLKLRAHSEPGGRIEIDQGTIAQMLNLSRTAVNAALRDLDLAQLVKKQRAGVYQLNAMIAPYLSPEDAIAAVKAMPKSERLNSTDFVDRYRRSVTAYQDQLAEKRRRREDAKRRQNLKAVS
ncbi:helix-turn-helix domain-containing protein [Streptomyces huasconensis]|uniref:Helix-turn-helix domain-containing protein n=1 Tax=Streptomyces huasconensis TaxID=1854574 RepID=A0ABV3M4G9_9ACTN|nr:MarR family transcriptional regulator [Streptomyces sp. SID335]MYZ15984.1 MarR family transcriptional regulator [Streptomyces sp. SID337]NDZ92356.1 winged helix-turn-helix domain-containing protein [Streptomyces sp. SID10115]NEA03832.1 winged helix-turn-helix domain-containing protein [Streptomyces sp. SID10116]NEB49603.1 winged helix-turn-helix domain-containing protein [Streptomyces sp. SID339]